MKREIKFRVWDKKRKRFGYFLLSQFGIDVPVESYLPLNLHRSDDDEIYRIEYEDIEWLQYTGLHDKNGKEIYEGDIVNATYQMNKNGETTKSELRIIDFGEYSFRASSKSGETRNRLTEYFFFEVIGNIYEHSNLLNNG